MVHLSAGESMSPALAAVFLFNISVGTGALALPLIFSKAGVVLGSLFMALVAFLAWTSNSFAIEAMSISNALLKLEGPRTSEEKKGNHSKTDVEQPLMHKDTGQSVDYEISELTEYGVMADLLLPRWGRVAWFTTIVLYFYGDLAVYCVFVPMTLAEVFPTIGPITDKAHVVRVYLAVMFAATFPWVFGDLQKTKMMQLVTFVTRHLCFWTMFIVCWHRIASGHGVGFSDITLFDVSELPLLFGGAIYSMISQMYIPSLMTPVQPKTNLNKIVGGVYTMMYAYYMVLCWSAMLAFSGQDALLDKCSVHTFHPCKLQKLLTFNFAYLRLPGLAQLVLVLPLVGLLTSTPVIAITLRKNLSVLFQLVWGWEFKTASSRVGLVLLAIVPPFTIALCTQSIDLVIHVTGSYGGCLIMFVFPAILAQAGRQKIRARYGTPAQQPLSNPYQSPLQSPHWIHGVLAWAAIVLVVNTYYLVTHG
jgi:amino acid permease